MNTTNQRDFYPGTDIPRIKPICAVNVSEEEFQAIGDSDNVSFIHKETGQEIELSWREIYEACVDYQEAREQAKRRAYV